MKFKRMMSYIIDLGIIMVITLLFKLIVNINVEEYATNIGNINEFFINGALSIEQYIKQISGLKQIMDQKEILIYAVNLILICVVAVIIPYYNKGRSIGQVMMKLKVTCSNGAVSIKQLLLRSVILYGYLELGFTILLSYTVPSNIYFIGVLILSFIQIVLVIVSIFMVLYRRDEKGLQDIISDTYVENI